MTGNDNRPTGSLSERRVTRREMLLTTGGALAGVLLLAGCGGGEGAQKKSAPPPVAGGFVGEVPEAATNPFVAIVADVPEGEGGGDEREVRAYLCDGDRINEWFWGSAGGNELELSSDGGARLEGNLAPDTSTGQITLPDGRSFPFEARLAGGVAGLYEVTVSEEGLVRGISEGGGRLEGRLAEEPNEEGLYPLSATVTAPDGTSQDFEALAPDAEPAEGRWVVLEDGRVKGGKKGLQTRGWSEPENP